MKKNVLVVAVLVIGLALCQVAAYAETVSGKVVSTDAAANTITVSKTDTTTGASSDAVISVSGTTTYSGVTGLSELMAGDEVKVEATEDAATKAWTATSVEKVVAPAPASEAPAATAPAVQ